MMYAKGEYVRAFHEVVKIAPVTLPKLNLGDLDVEAIEAEARQAATKVKTIRAGRESHRRSPSGRQGSCASRHRS